MEDKNNQFLRAVMMTIGGLIGVGIFGLPYVFSRAGVAIGLIHLLVLGITMLIMMLAYSDLVLQFPGRPRLKAIVEHYLGPIWANIVSAAFIVGVWGALLSYTIVGGTFLHALLSPMLGGQYFWYQIAFFTISSILLLGGLGIVSRLEILFIAIMFLLLGVVFVGSAPFISVDNFALFHWARGFEPFGAILFATAGLGVIPEAADILGRSKGHLLKKVVFFGALIVLAVYALFSLTVVGVSGSQTSPEAIIGLAPYLGNWLMYLGVIIGVTTLFSSFMMVGTEVVSMLDNDYKCRYLVCWFSTIIVPLIVFLLGARNFIQVISFVGGLIVSLVGLIVIAAYLKAKKHPGVSKRALLIPNFALYFCGVIYLIAALTTLFNR